MSEPSNSQSPNANRSPPSRKVNAKLVILSRYDRQGASSRLRTMQYLPYLEAAGFDVEIASFFDADYLDALYSKRATKRSMASYFSGRLGQLWRARKADVIWVEKEALPWVPWPIERLVYPAKVPLVSDYDDAVFHRYDLNRKGLVRWLLGRKIDGLMAASRTVFAGNSYLAERARTAGAPSVETVPTVVDTCAYGWQPDPAPDGKLRIGWIGTPQTWAEFGVPMMGMLKAAVQDQGAIIRAVGAGSPTQPISGFEFPAWSEDSEIALIQGMDIGIMPLPDTPWARGKCGYKLIQYMACGLPVIASPVGVNRQIVEHGINGFLAETEADWANALATLLADPVLRRRMGDAGRLKVEQQFSLRVFGPKVARMLLAVAGQERGSRR